MSASSPNALQHSGPLFGNTHVNITTCAYPLWGQHGEKLPVGITFKWLMKLITLTALILTSISSLFLIWKHLHRYTVPKEQRQIIRIVFLPIFMCIISTLSIFFYVQSIYIKPISETYQAFCIAAIFLLFLEYICPDADERPKFFNNLENKDKKGKPIPGGSLLWYNRTYMMVFQYPLTKTLMCLIEILTQMGGVFCTNNFSPRYAHIWLMLIDIFVIGGALTAVFRFYGRLKRDFPPSRRALAKLIAFKGMVLFQFLQEILFGFLNGKVFKPNKVYTYDDLYYGLPSMLTALEAMLFCFAFHYAYGSREYHESSRPGARRLPVARAILDALNLSDIVFGVVTAIKIFITKSSPKGKGLNFDWGRNGNAYDAPKRQRTKELNDLAFEPLHQREGRLEEVEMGAQAHGEQRFEAPQFGSQEYGRVGAHSPPEEFRGYGEYRDDRLGLLQDTRTRDPSPGRPAATPRDMV